MDEPNPEPLNNIVELDETYAGGKFANMNRKRRKKYQRLTVIGANSFKDMVRKNVKEEATVITDQHLGYKGLDAEYAAHLSVNHSEMQFRQGLAYTNSVEGFFSCLKRSLIGIYHYASPKHLQKYCNETAYRYNTRSFSNFFRPEMGPIYLK